jgi:hypothetical protein
VTAKRGTPQAARYLTTHNNNTNNNRGQTMQLDTLEYSNQTWSPIKQAINDPQAAALVLVFGNSDQSNPAQLYNGIRERYPNARIIGASTAGNILGDEIHRTDAIATAIRFKQAKVHIASTRFSPNDNTRDLARQLLAQLPAEGLRHVLVLTDGLLLSGSELAEGFNRSKPDILISGGMAADGKRFQSTWTMADDLPCSSQIVVAGLYGDSLAIGCGSYAGWSAFGATRKVTRSSGNILYELDNEPALALYKRYLGTFATDLPESGMRFPLSIQTDDNNPGVIRTLLGIDEENQSIRLAGNIPQGSYTRLMHPNFNRLINGAEEATRSAPRINQEPALALIVSCVGRRSVMADQVEDELCVIQDSLGEKVQLTGFYSYGEIGPMQATGNQCHLHNQTITVTSIYEQ